MARQGFLWRAFLSTVPSQATVKSLCSKRPVDAGAAQVRCCHDLAHRLSGKIRIRGAVAFFLP